jgi:hypothetical protein
MTITLTDAGLKRIGPMTDPWVDQFNSNWDILQAMNAVGGLAVVPRDLDPDTFAPTSRYFRVTPGYFVYGNMLVRSVGFADLLAPASASTHIWLDPLGNLGTGPALPVGQMFTPLAFITTDANVILSIADYRCAQTAIGGPLTVSRVAVSTDHTHQAQYNYIRADATNAPITITLAYPGTVRGQLIVVRKVDASANAVTVTSAYNIEGNISYPITSARSAAFSAHPTVDTYEVVF